MVIKNSVKRTHSKLQVGLALSFVALFVANVIAWAPAVVLGSHRLEMTGKYFYEDHGWVYEVTYGHYVLSWILFLSGLSVFCLGFIIALIRTLRDKRHTKGNSKSLPRYLKWVIVTIFIFLVGIIAFGTYRAHKSWATYPNPPASPFDLVGDVRGASTVFFDQCGRYPTSPSELVGTGHLHTLVAEILSEGRVMWNYHFTYTSDGSYFECVGLPVNQNPNAYVYFVSSKGGNYRIFKWTSLDELREAIAAKSF